jgi:hypothetical protein
MLINKQNTILFSPLPFPLIKLENLWTRGGILDIAWLRGGILGAQFSGLCVVAHVAPTTRWACLQSLLL